MGRVIHSARSARQEAGTVVRPRVGRKRADRDGFSSVETVILKDDDGPRLARIVLAAGNGPDVAASHSCPSTSSTNVDTASMNA